MMLFPTIIEYTFKFLDRIINTIEDRFDQEDFRSFVKFENLLLKAAKGYVFIRECNDVMEIYGSDFNENRFQLQLETLQEQCTNLVGTACIRSVTDALMNLRVESHLSETFKLTKPLLVLIATSGQHCHERENIQFAEANRKLFTIDSETNHLMILSTYKNQLDQLDLTKIASDFINEARKHIFGKFNLRLASMYIACFRFSLV